MALATYNILNKCPRAAVSPCHSDPCKNGGVCHDLWSDYLCECKSPFIGRKCAKESSEEVVLRFTGNDYMEYVIKEKFKRDFLLKQLLDDKKEGNDQNQTGINIKFKTRNNGVLMSVLGQTGYIVLKIRDRRLVYQSEDAVSGHQSDFTVDSPVADGVWHVVSLFGKGQIPFLALDGKPVWNITDQSVDLSPVRVEKIVLGADLSLHSKLQQSGFTGCVQYLNVSGHTLPVSGRSAMVDIWPSWTLMQSSCISPGVCLPSPCSEEDTARRGCLYGQCENRWRCGPAGENSSCICFHNVSDHACDICISAPDSQDLCSAAGGSGPLWLIAVILPLTSILVVLGMIVALRRVRRHQGSSECLEQKTEPGTENAAFCFDDNRPLTNAASAERERQNGPARADQQSVELYCDACPSSVQPEPNSEPEYYEIGCISSAFHSDSASLRLSRHKHLHGTKRVSADPQRCSDLKMLSAGFKRGPSGEERDKSPRKPQNMDTLNKLLLTTIDAEQSQHSPPCYTKRIPQPGLPEPVQCLTFEEISKLNAPLEQTLSNQVFPSRTPTIDVSSDSDTDSTSTFSESGYGQVSVIGTRKYGHEQSNLSTHSCRQPFPVSKFFKPSAAGQLEDENAPSSMFEHWGKVLNMHLPYSSYVPVFEDVARLPLEPSHSYDMQSDIEEII